MRPEASNTCAAYPACWSRYAQTSPASPAPTTTIRVPGGGAPFAIAGSASRPRRDAPTRVAPAPFRNPRRVVLASSSAMHATASSTAFASGVRANFRPPGLNDDRMTVRDSGSRCNPVRPRQHEQQPHERDIPREDDARIVERIDVVEVAVGQPDLRQDEG